LINSGIVKGEMTIFVGLLKCTNPECKNAGREDVERWELKDYLGYSCGTVCDDCYEKQKVKYELIKNRSILTKSR